MKKKKIVMGIISVIIIITLLVIMMHPWTMGLPLYGWTYSEALTDEFYIGEWGDNIPPFGYTYKVYISDDLVPPEGGFFIRLYGQPVVPGAWWELNREGHYLDGEFYWDVYHET